MIEQIGLKGAKTLKIPGVKEEKKSDRELREDIDMIIDKNEYPYESMIITDIGIQREANDNIESMCGRCHAKFNSRNELFKQLEDEDHMVISKGDEDEHIDIMANKRGSRKSAAATGSSSSCRSTSRRTSKMSAALVIGRKHMVGKRMMQRILGPLMSQTPCQC